MAQAATLREPHDSLSLRFGGAALNWTNPVGTA